VLLARYREEAKTVMRKMDGRVIPFREEAERLARDYLKRMGLSSRAAPAKAEGEPRKLQRIACVRCGTSNEPDAAFCKQCAASLTREQGGTRT
jgi:ribosomal protein L40E